MHVCMTIYKGWTYACIHTYLCTLTDCCAYMHEDRHRAGLSGLTQHDRAAPLGPSPGHR